MELMTKSDHSSGAVILNGKQLILWSLAVAFFGVFFAVPLRKQTIIREKLKFPSGTATAQMIGLLHQRPDPTLKKTTTTFKRRTTTTVRHNTEDERQPLLPPTTETINYHQQTPDHEDIVDFEHSWIIKLRGLLVSFLASSVYTVSSYFVPALTTLPIFNWISFGLIDFKSWMWYFNPSFSYIGQGIIMGLPTTLSMLLGCIVGWGLLSPLAFYAGWAPGPVDDWKEGSKGWILWISLGVMIADSCVSLLVVLVKSLAKLFRPSKSVDDTTTTRLRNQEDITEEYIEVEEEEIDAPKSEQISTTTAILGLILSTVSCVYLIRTVFGPDVLPKSMTLLAVIVAMFLSILGVRALGETDLNPVTGISKISQVLFAGIMPGSILANLIAGGIAEAGAQQAGDLMQDLKTGHLLGASPKAQFYGQMIGSFASVFIATGAYLLYRSVYHIPGPEFPVPTAQVWLDMSRLVNGHQLPPHVSEFVFAFAILFTIFVLLKELYPRNWSKFIPQGIAFAIGMYNPPAFTLARVIGGLVSHFWNKYCDSQLKHEENYTGFKAWLEPYRVIGGKVFIVVVASGFVLGEGTFAIVNMMMRAYNVPHF